MPDHVLEDEDDERSDNIDAMFFGAPTAVADAALESKADSKAPQFSETEYIDMPERLSEDVDINMDIDEDYDQTETE